MFFCHVRDRCSMIFIFSRIPQIQNAHDVPLPFVCLWSFAAHGQRLKPLHPKALEPAGKVQRFPGIVFFNCFWSLLWEVYGNPKYKSEVLFDFQSPCRLEAKPWIRSLDRASVSEMFRTWRALVAVGWRSKQEWNYYQKHPRTNKGGFKMLHSRQPLGFACLQHLLNVWTLDVNAAVRFSWEPSINTVGLDLFQPRNAPRGLPCRLYFTAAISEVSNVWAEDLRMCQMTKSQRNQHCPTL